jgi:hypothetical protein
MLGEVSILLKDPILFTITIQLKAQQGLSHRCQHGHLFIMTDIRHEALHSTRKCIFAGKVELGG